MMDKYFKMEMELCDLLIKLYDGELAIKADRKGITIEDMEKNPVAKYNDILRQHPALCKQHPMKAGIAHGIVGIYLAMMDPESFLKINTGAYMLRTAKTVADASYKTPTYDPRRN